MEIHVTLPGHWYQMEWHLVRLPPCSIFSAMRLWICPALEVGKISTAKPTNNSRAQGNFSSEQKFKLRRIHTVEWEELM